MKKFIINIGLFSVFALLFYIIVLPLWSAVFPPFMAKNVRSCIGCYGHLYSRVRDIPNVKNPDILFLGSSHAYRGLDTRVFAKHGISAFNLGSSSQTPLNSQVLLKQYLDKIQPKMVIIEAYAETLGADGAESSLDLLSNNPIDTHSVNMITGTKNISLYNTLIYGYFRQIFNLNKNFQEPEKLNDDIYIKNGGFVETTFRKNPLNEEKEGEWSINPKQITALKENIAMLKQRNIPYLLIQAPITKKLYNARTNNAEMDSLLSSLGTYKNFQNEVLLNDTLDFYDSNHLNQQAVVRFNEKLIDWLKAHNEKYK
ncbi:MAG: hypothetical protein Q4C75_04870 [Bergeyella zoohelcum]|nr:hypothetical protein [Bergeyella zoohelcum]